jgi:hypothetical protein
MKDLEIELDFFIGLYQGQIAAGHTELLQHIYAQDTLPWTMDDFRVFSKVAGSSLVTLRLAQDCREEWEYVHPVDLPILTSIVRDELPNLRTFEFAMSEIRSAEQVCALLLTEDKLHPGGSLTRLVRSTEGDEYPCLFNVIRCLSPMCAQNASIYVAVGKHWYNNWTKDDQTKCLRYLRA